MNRISVTLKGRTVYWEFSADKIAQLLQALVQSFGPAKED